jgi:iron(III) transport system permease protein
VTGGPPERAGRAAGARLAAWRRGGDRVRTGTLVAVGVLLVYLVVVPLLFLVYGSLVTGSPGQPGTFSARTYAEVLTAPRTYRLLAVSAVYAIGASLVAFVIGGAVAWLVQRTDLPGKGLVTFLTLFPLFMPPVLTTVAWALLLDPNMGLLNRIAQGLGAARAPFDVNTLLSMIWVGGVLDVPLVFLWLWPAFAAMDPGLEEAAAMCRARPLTVMRTITLPLLLPAMAATFLINFVLAIEDITVPIIIGLPAGIHVFATEIFLAYTRVPTDVHSASVHAIILLAITVGLTVLYRRLTARSERYAVVRGRGYRPAPIRLGRARLPVASLLAGLLAVVVGLPLFVLAWTSLSPYLQVPSVAGLRSLSLRWYRALLQDPMVIRGFVNTTVLGLGSAAAVMAVSVVVGWTVIRVRARWRGLLDLLAFMPIAIPGLVIGLSLMWLYLTLPVPVYGTLWVLGIAFVTRFVPYGVRLAYAGFSQLHAELEEAAYVAGSGWGKAMRTISLPLLAPTLTVGAIYTILRSFRELGASLLLASFENEPYSVVAYNIWMGGETGKTAAYGIVAIVIMTALVMGVQRLVGRRSLAE